MLHINNNSLHITDSAKKEGLLVEMFGGLSKHKKNWVEKENSTDVDERREEQQGLSPSAFSLNHSPLTLHQT